MLLDYIPRGIITISTDASLNDNTEASAFAFWITAHDVVYKKAGRFKNLLHDPTQAEMQAIANAAYFLSNSDLRFFAEKIIIQTDSLWSINRIARPPDDFCRNIRQIVYRLVPRFSPPDEKTDLRFQYVKAHTTRTDQASNENRWCDSEAKKEMRILKAEILKKRREQKKQAFYSKRLYR